MSKWSDHSRVTTASVLCVLGLALPGLAFADKDGKEPECSARTLHGAYLFAATGFIISPTGAALPKAIVERIDFNGDETLHVPAATRSLNGVVSRSAPGDATYQVNPDCTGTLTFNPALHFDIFVSPDGRELTMIQFDQGNVLQGKVTKLR
jgi:hypothetical protein